MKLKDKLFNGLVFSGFLVVVAIVAAFMFQDILGYKINLFNKEVVEEETTITVVEEETSKTIDYSKLPTLQDMLAEDEKAAKAAAKEKAEANKKETEPVTFPAETAAEIQVAKLEIPEEKPTVITNGEKTGIITNPKTDENGNISQKPVETTVPKATEPATTAPSNDSKPKEETPTNSENAALDAWNKMVEDAKAAGGGIDSNTSIEFKGELTGEYTGW